MIKLSKILFESNYIDYSAPTFCLVKTTSNTSNPVIVLLHKQNFIDCCLNVLDPTDISLDMIEEACAAFVEVKPSMYGCMLAMQVKFVASSSKYPGAGKLIYELAGEYFGQPLTSDRSHSSSDDAKTRWAKIEQDKANWQPVGANEDLDNYYYGDEGKTYVKFQGHYPNRSYKELGPDPQTPEKIDDCPLPNKAGLDSEIDEIQRILGSAGAYEYIGPSKVQPLIAEGSRTLQYIEKEKPYLNISHTLETITDHLFNSRY